MISKINEFIDLLINVFSGKEFPEPGPDDQKIRHETEKIKFVLVRQFYTIDDEDRQRIFIRNFHARLVYLHDYFFERTEKSNPEKPEIHDTLVKSPKLLSIHQSVLSVLDDLLAFVMEQFSMWCSERQKIPKRLRLSFTSEILEKLEALDFPVTDPEYALFGKVKDSVCCRLTENHHNVTYRLVSYLRSFIETVGMIRTGRQEHPLLTTLTDILIAANFNAISVMEDLTARIREEVEKIGSAKEQIEYLNSWLKKIDQVPVNPVCTFDEQSESLSLFLCKWIEVEILFHEKSLQLFSDPFYPSGFPGIPGGFKLEVDLSVAQMSCLLRLLKECSIIKSGKIMELFGFLALHFRSKKQENISAESVRGNFYNITESTREEVRKVILRLLKKVSSPL
ncbi:MAG: hypothetical protein AB2L24_24425 [Mangrovibacterium sp.]